MSDMETITRVQPKRNRWGQYVIPRDDKEQAYQRVTTFAAMVADTYNLSRWQIRSALAGVSQRHDLYASFAALADPHGADKSEANRIADEAIEASSANAGRNLGTALHAYTERVDFGEDFTPPPPWDADVAAYARTLAEAGVKLDPSYIERVVVVEQLGIAGTFDRLARIGDELYVADLKTGKDPAAFPHEICIQLACYAHADDLFDPATQKRTPMPKVNQDRALVIHLPPGEATCTLHWFDIAAGWEMTDHCRTVREWRKRKKLAAAFEMPLAPVLARSVTNFPAPASAPRSLPDEGSEGDAWLEKVKAGVAASNLDAVDEATLIRWVAEGDQAQNWWRIGASPSERRFHCYRGALRLARWAADDDDARTLLGLIVGETIQPSVLVGGVIGSLSIAEADQLASLLTAIEAGTKTLTFADDGKPVIAEAA